MLERQIGKFIKITIVLSIASWLALFLFLNVSPTRSVILTVAVLSALWTFYFKFGWKWPMLNKIFNMPNLNGTWVGFWVIFDRYHITPGDGLLFIRQRRRLQFPVRDILRSSSLHSAHRCPETTCRIPWPLLRCLSGTRWDRDILSFLPTSLCCRGFSP